MRNRAPSAADPAVAKAPVITQAGPGLVRVAERRPPDWRLRRQARLARPAAAVVLRASIVDAPRTSPSKHHRRKDDREDHEEVGETDGIKARSVNLRHARRLPCPGLH
jgi:hypothetical protein